MDYVEKSDYSGKRHALNGWDTWCGIDTLKSPYGHWVTGRCIASWIDCERCRKAMRREGWEV